MISGMAIEDVVSAKMAYEKYEQQRLHGGTGTM